jgi:signal transduction histidine kinase
MEDDEAQARLVQKCMELQGFCVDVAPDGNAGLARYSETHYDAVVVDQTMPGLCGLDVVRAMSERGPLPPLVMVTGTGNERTAVEAMKLGVSEYLVKDLEGGFVNVLPMLVRRAIDQQRTLHQKQQMERELAQAEKLKAIGQLAAGIAHEINTPTQYIGDNTRFLQDAFRDISSLLGVYDRLLHAAQKDEVTDEMIHEVESRLLRADLDYLTTEIPQAIEQSLEGVDHVTKIVSAMKEYSHPDSHRKQPVDLNHTIEHSLTLCRNEWKYVAEIVEDFDPNLPPVCCLQSEIHRVVLNLVINAAHAIAEASRGEIERKRTITVRTRHDGPWAEIRVEDEGTGIAPEVRDHIFEPFFTTKEIGEGTGQGLAIARTIIVDKHSGSIHFETEVGHGTTFIVRLPIDGQPRPQEETAAEQHSLELEAVS